MFSSDSNSNRWIDDAWTAAQRALGRAATDPSQPSRYVSLEELVRDETEVWVRVWDLTLEREVTMKRLHAPPSSPSPTTLAKVGPIQNFLEEAWIAGQLNHPGIVPVHELGIDADGKLFVTMRPVAGRSLADVIACAPDGRDNFTRARTLDALLEVCDTVAYAHSRGIVHQNLHSENVLVGQFGETYVLGWGLARGFADLAHRAGVRSSNYLAPEQVSPEYGEVGPHTDVYAIGAMLYHLLSGHDPYADDAVVRAREETLARIRTHAPKPIDKTASREPRELIAICEKAMARDPRARYADMASMARDLRAHVENRVVHAYRTGPWAELRKWIGRNRATATAAACAILIALGGLGTIAAVTSIKNRALAVTRANLEVQLGNVRRLASIERVRSLGRTADEPWPALPAQLPAMRRWCEEAQRLEAERPLHVAARAALLARREPGSSESSPTFADTVDSWWYANVEELQRGIDALSEDSPSRVGTLREMETRIARAESVERRSLEEHADEWSEAISEIAADPRYGGLELIEQVGLVPIGRDPESGWFEFWHVDSGARPERDPHTKLLTMTEESGLVLVLLPGGTFKFGAQRADASLPNYEPAALSSQRVVPDVTLSPCFLSKFEMTQAQWLRTMGSNPSEHRPDSTQCAQTHSLLDPVHSISWNDAQRAAKRLALQLPTSAQWEFAARAGTSSAFPSGQHPAFGRDMGNIADQSFARCFQTPDTTPESWDDGFACVAPIGRFHPNPCGLYDMAGNVSELCRDEYLSTPDIDFATGDGEQHRRTSGQASRLRVVRGGSFASSKSFTSAGLAQGASDSATAVVFGVRMARGIDP